MRCPGTRIPWNSRCRPRGGRGRAGCQGRSGSNPWSRRCRGWSCRRIFRTCRLCWCDVGLIRHASSILRVPFCERRDAGMSWSRWWLKLIYPFGFCEVVVYVFHFPHFLDTYSTICSKSMSSYTRSTEGSRINIMWIAENRIVPQPDVDVFRLHCKFDLWFSSRISRTLSFDMAYKVTTAIWNKKCSFKIEW